MREFIRWRLACLRDPEDRHTGEQIARWRMAYVEHPFQILVIYLALHHYVALLPWWHFPDLANPLEAVIGAVLITILFEVLYDHLWRTLRRSNPTSWLDSFWDVVVSLAIVAVVLPPLVALGYIAVWAGVLFVFAPSIAGKTWSRP